MSSTSLTFLSHIPVRPGLETERRLGWLITVAGIEKYSPSSYRYLGALQRPCGTTGSCLEGQILACTQNLKWQFLLAVNLTRRCFSSDLTVCRDYFLLCHPLPVAQIFIGLCSTSVKFQINFIMFWDCASKGSSMVTLRSVVCSFSVNTHLDETFGAIFHP